MNGIPVFCQLVPPGTRLRPGTCHAPHAAPWWDLPAHVTAANLGWWITGLLVTGLILARVRSRHRRSVTAAR